MIVKVDGVFSFSPLLFMCVCSLSICTHCIAPHTLFVNVRFITYVKFKSLDGWTPLVYAANKNNLDMVKVLLDAKAEVNVQNKVLENDGV